MKPARLTIAAAVLVLMAACSLVPSVRIPQDHYYRLPRPSPALTYQRPPLQGEVGVTPLRGIGLYQEQPILYVQRSSPLELHQYNYHLWVAPPTRLVQDHLVAYLRAAGAASEVDRARAGAGDGAVVSGEVRRFERVVEKGHGDVHVALDLSLGPPDRFKPRRFSHRYTAVVPVGGKSMEAVVQAFGTAIDRIAARFLADLAATGPGGGH